MHPPRFVLFCILSFASVSFAQTHDAPPVDTKLPFQLKLLAPNVWAAIDDAKGDAGANAGFVIGDNGVAIIDAFENEAAATALLNEIHRLTPLPIRFVINTHYHIDHVAGNRVFAKQGAVIIGHRRIRSWIHTENLKFFGDKIKPEQKAMVENLLAPDVTYDSGVTLFLGSRRLDVQFLAGHTGGDSVVVVRGAGVVFCGDLFWRKTLPNLIDASTGDWISSLSSLAELSSGGAPNSAIFPVAEYVPGHGEVGNLEDLEDFQNYLINLRFMLEKPVQDGLKGDALVAAALPELTKQYGSWNHFKFFSRSNILDTGAELEGIKRVPPDEKK